MKHFLVGSVVFLFLGLWASKAEAQSWACSAEYSGDQCMADAGSGGYGGGGGGGAAVCPTATDYSSCIKRCDCEYANNYKKCNGGRSCIDVALAERDACYGHCVSDWYY